MKARRIDRRIGASLGFRGLLLSLIAIASLGTVDGSPRPIDAEPEGLPLPEPLIPLAAPFDLLGTEVVPGTLARLELHTSESFAGSWLSTPVAVVHGVSMGPRLCIVAGIHGDEVNGVEVVRRVLRRLDPDQLRGTVIAVPIANLSAFRSGSRYLPDRRDLNRYFPGRPFGSSASRIAHGLWDNVLKHCHAIVDLHTGSFHRTNLHQLRANLSDQGTVELSVAFAAEVVVNTVGREGTLRRAATDAGIAAITVEAGESARFDESHVVEAMAGILRLLKAKGMIALGMDAPATETLLSPTAYLRTRWVRVDQGGILVSSVRLGDVVETDQQLGTVSDPLSDEVTSIASPITGRVIGMALDQVVMPGFAAFHLAYEPRPLRVSPDWAAIPPEVSAEDDGGAVDLEERPE